MVLINFSKKKTCRNIKKCRPLGSNFMRRSSMFTSINSRNAIRYKTKKKSKFWLTKNKKRSFKNYNQLDNLNIIENKFFFLIGMKAGSLRSIIWKC